MCDKWPHALDLKTTTIYLVHNSLEEWFGLGWPQSLSVLLLPLRETALLPGLAGWYVGLQKGLVPWISHHWAGYTWASSHGDGRLPSTASGMCQCISAFQASGRISFSNISLAKASHRFALHSRGREIDTTPGQEHLQHHTVRAWL